MAPSSDWDASSDDEKPPVVPARNKWEGEDEDDNIKDDWDAESEDEKPKEQEPPKPTGPIRRKGITKQKIAEKEAIAAAEQEQREIEEAEANDPILRKKREQAQTEKADMESARGLFGDMAVSSGGNDENPLNMQVKTKADFDDLAEKLSTILIEKHGKHKSYASFVESLARQLSAPLKDIEVRKAASTLSTVANEKQRLNSANNKKKTKASAKPSVAVKPAASTRGGGNKDYDNLVDDFIDGDDDFM